MTKTLSLSVVQQAHGHGVRRRFSCLVIALLVAVVAGPSWSVLAAFALTTIDSAPNGIVGQWSSIKVRSNGNPIISYYDSGNSALKLAICGNPACSGANIISTLLGNGNGQGTSLALSSTGAPVISFYSATLQAVRVLICGDPTCAANNTVSTVELVGNAAGYPTSLRLTYDNRPVISYTSMTFNTEGPRLAICADVTCSSLTIRMLDLRFTGTRTALALTESDIPIISYYHSFMLKLAVCADSACTAKTTRTIDTSNGAGTLSTLALDEAGHPVIAYYDGGMLDLKFAVCADLPCTSTTQTTIDSVGFVGSWPALSMVGGLPAISYFDETNTNLKLALCANVTCTQKTLSTIDSNGIVGSYTSLARDTAGSIFISYFDNSNGALKVAADYVPPPTSTPTATPTMTPTATLTNIPTATPIASFTMTPSETATATLTLTPSPSPSATSTSRPPGPDSIGIYRPSENTFYLRNTNTTGPADLVIPFGSGGNAYPVVGDWDGDQVDTIGIYDRALGTFSLRNSNSTGPAMITLTLGNPGDQPIAGRWSASLTHDGVGVYRPSNGVLYLKITLTTGYADYFAILGNPSDIGVAGDWDGDGLDSPGVYRPAQARFFLSNNPAPGGIIYSDLDLILGNPNTDGPLAGDWDADRKSGVGVFRMTNGIVYLKNSLSTGYADVALIYGIAGDIPVAGRWISPPGASASILANNRFNDPITRAAPGE